MKLLSGISSRPCLTPLGDSAIWPCIASVVEFSHSISANEREDYFGITLIALECRRDMRLLSKPTL